MKLCIAIVAALLGYLCVSAPSLAAAATDACEPDVDNTNYSAAVTDCTQAIQANQRDADAFTNRDYERERAPPLGTRPASSGFR